MRDLNSPSISLFEQLGSGIDVQGQVPVPKVHRYAEDADEGEIAPSEVPGGAMQPTEELPSNMTDMKFTHALIKHLDQLYSKMLAGDVKELASEPKYSPKTRILEGQTNEMILEEKESYYNPGNSAVTEST